MNILRTVRGVAVHKAHEVSRFSDGKESSDACVKTASQVLIYFVDDNTDLAGTVFCSAVIHDTAGVVFTAVIDGTNSKFISVPEELVILLHPFIYENADVEFLVITGQKNVQFIH
jgi:hypothetical protein